MNELTIDLCCKLVVLVEISFLLPPIVGIEPVVCQLFQIRNGYAAFPTGAFNLVWPAGILDAIT